MAIYLVTPLGHNADQVGEAIRSAMNEADYHPLQGRAGWLVSFKGTSVELSHLLGITSPEKGSPAKLGSVMVTGVGSYYGRGPTTMWEWLKTRIEGQ